MITELATDILTDAMNALIPAVQASQRSKGIRDLGGSAGSLRVAVLSKDTTLRGQLFGFARWEYQERGRGPNRSRKPSRQMVKDLSEWAVRHGMDEGAGWPIAMKIAREGIRVPNPHNPGGVLSDVLNAADVRDTIAPRLRSAILNELKTDLSFARL